MDIRISPKAVCRQMLANLNRLEPLSAREEARLLAAIEESQVPDAANRLLADMSRNTLRLVIDQT